MKEVMIHIDKKAHLEYRREEIITGTAQLLKKLPNEHTVYIAGAISSLMLMISAATSLLNKDTYIMVKVIAVIAGIAGCMALPYAIRKYTEHRLNIKTLRTGLADVKNAGEEELESAIKNMELLLKAILKAEQKIGYPMIYGTGIGGTLYHIAGYEPIPATIETLGETCRISYNYKGEKGDIYLSSGMIKREVREDITEERLEYIGDDIIYVCRPGQEE